MITLSLPSGPFAVRFWHRFGFPHHRKAWCERPLPAGMPAGRFSTRFGRHSRCANLLQNAGHRATHLSWGERTLVAFPGTQHRQAQVVAHEQQITGARHYPTPPLDLLRRAQMGAGPQQVLLEKAIAMLLREALAIPRTHLLQRHVFVAGPVNQLMRGSRLVSRAASRCTRITPTPASGASRKCSPFQQQTTTRFPCSSVPSHWASAGPYVSGRVP